MVIIFTECCVTDGNDYDDGGDDIDGDGDNDGGDDIDGDGDDDGGA